jgi:hypothetical protein
MHTRSLRVVFDMLAIETIGFIMVNIVLQTASDDHIQTLFGCPSVSASLKGKYAAFGNPFLRTILVIHKWFCYIAC